MMKFIFISYFIEAWWVIQSFSKMSTILLMTEFILARLRIPILLMTILLSAVKIRLGRILLILFNEPVSQSEL